MSPWYTRTRPLAISASSESRKPPRGRKGHPGHGPHRSAWLSDRRAFTWHRPGARGGRGRELPGEGRPQVGSEGQRAAPLTFGGGLGELAVDVSHHARRLLVALRVDVPQHQQRPAPGKLQGEETAQAAARPGDQAHLPRHALLLGPHQPLGSGQHERPQHSECDHEQLQQDVHAGGPSPPARRPSPPPTAAGTARSLPSPGSAPGAAVLAGTARYRWSSRCRGCPAPPAAARDAPCSVPHPTLNEGAQAKRSPSAPSPHARGPAVGSEHLAHSAPYIGRAGRRGPSSRAPQPSPGPAPHSRDPHPRRGPSSPRSPAPPPGEGPAAAPGSGAPTAASPSRAARPDSGPSRARPPTTCPSVHRPAPCSATLRQRLERRAAGPPEEGGGRSAAAGGENGFCANTRFYRCYRRWWMLFTFPVIVLMRPGGYKV